MIRRTSIILLFYGAIFFIIPVAIITIGGSVAIVPIIGSVLWAVLYAFYLIPGVYGVNSCGQLMTQMILFMPLGMLMLPPMVSNKTDAKYGFYEQAEQLANYIDKLTGPFLGIALCGLFVSSAAIMISVASLFLISKYYVSECSLVSCNIFYSVFGIVPISTLTSLQLIIVICVCSLCISVFNTTITNAYLTVHGLIK